MAAVGQGQTYILARSTQWSKTLFRVLFLDSNAVVTQTIQLEPVLPAYTSVAIGHFAGAPGIDVAVMVKGHLRILRYLWNGTKKTSLALGIPPSGLSEIVGIGDFDGDHRNEVVLQNPATRHLGCIELQPEGTSEYFPLINDIPNSTYTQIAGVCDVDSDGWTDIVYEDPTNQHFKYGYFYQNTLLSYSYNDFDPSVDQPYHWPYLGFADIDGDGYADAFTRPPVPLYRRVWKMYGIIRLENDVVSGLVNGYKHWDYLAVGK
jgi:hypothetical protein